MLKKSVLAAINDADDAIARFDTGRSRLDALLEAESSRHFIALDIARSQASSGIVAN